jgi:hypothetical protein
MISTPFMKIDGLFREFPMETSTNPTCTRFGKHNFVVSNSYNFTKLISLGNKAPVVHTITVSYILSWSGTRGTDASITISVSDTLSAGSGTFEVMSRIDPEIKDLTALGYDKAYIFQNNNWQHLNLESTYYCSPPLDTSWHNTKIRQKDARGQPPQWNSNIGYEPFNTGTFYGSSKYWIPPDLIEVVRYWGNEYKGPPGFANNEGIAQEDIVIWTDCGPIITPAPAVASYPNSIDFKFWLH